MASVALVGLAQFPRDIDQLPSQIGEDIAEPGRVVAWAGQALDKSDPDRVADADENDREIER
jgi:hypothetical protein